MSHKVSPKSNTSFDGALLAKDVGDCHHFIGPDSHQAFVAERANRSIHQLKCALREVDATIEEDALDPSTSINVENVDTGVAWHELQHSHAGECGCQSVAQSGLSQLCRPQST